MSLCMPSELCLEQITVHSNLHLWWSDQHECLNLIVQRVFIFFNQFFVQGDVYFYLFYYTQPKKWRHAIHLFFCLFSGLKWHTKRFWCKTKYSWQWMHFRFSWMTNDRLCPCIMHYPGSINLLFADERWQAEEHICFCFTDLSGHRTGKPV